ncbi:MAG TPA: flagellar hook-associated protein FlgL [Nitrospirota bacterium]
MRITESGMHRTVLDGLYRRVNELLKTQEQITTGKKINNPSDDPAGAAKISALKTVLSRSDQYTRNISAGSMNMMTADSVLLDAHNLLERAKELAIGQAGGTSTAQTRAMAAEEVGTLTNQLLQVANTSVGGIYIFAGYKNNTAPFDASGNYVSDSNKINIEIEPGTFSQINLPGDQIFNPAGGVDVFKALSDLKTAMVGDDTAGIKTAMDQITTSFDQVEGGQAIAGSLINQFDTSKARIEDKVITYKQLLSGEEDLDLADAIGTLNVQDAALTAAREVTARLFKSSILDFLK